MLPPSVRIILCLALFPVAFAGCDNSVAGPATVAVTGTVSKDGTPLEGANVIFHPIADSGQVLASQAVTDAQGRFELSTHVGAGTFKPGVVPGRYAVAITKLDTASIATTLAPPKNLLPKKYTDPKTSGLIAEVVEGQENDFEFVLSSS
jgi:hypothetical protein